MNKSFKVFAIVVAGLAWLSIIFTSLARYFGDGYEQILDSIGLGLIFSTVFSLFSFAITLKIILSCGIKKINPALILFGLAPIFVLALEGLFYVGKDGITFNLP